MHFDQNNETLFVDSFFGRSGQWAWIGPIASITIIYQLMELIENHLCCPSPIPLWALIFAGLFLLLLLFTGLLFSFQGIVTAQKISLQEEALSITFYFGRKLRVSIRDIIEVKELSTSKLLSNFSTPLGRGGSYYKVIRQSGSPFYVSESSSELSKLIEIVRNQMNAE